MRLKHHVESLLQLILAAASLALIGMMVMELRPAPISARASGATTVLPDTPAPSPPEARPFPPLEAYAAMIERPLFSPDRRPRSTAASAASVGSVQSPAATGDPAEMILTAVAITGERPLAIVETARGKSVHKVGIGESVNGWTLTEILPEAVSLKKGGEVRMLELRIQGSPPPQKQAAQPRSRPGDAPGETEKKETKAGEDAGSPPAPRQSGDSGG